ncbi:hypothetical protein [uncultured Meiothermus sp.]|uniref:hypothetical protein n=1 Tax=uncultured Meiothermus sp. TaxID=157471 RepID=UPI00260F2111|nr:hypothetical protein [uncultured Meiothermus sp.]
MSDKAFVNGWLRVLQEAMEGGEPGQGTAFLDGTGADGSGNHGLLATLEALSADQASYPTALGMSVAAQAAHTAYYMEVTVRWVQGDRGPFDWKGSFVGTVSEGEWAALRTRVRVAYDEVVKLASNTPRWDGDEPGGLAATLAHACYHLGAIRQIVKLV